MKNRNNKQNTAVMKERFTEPEIEIIAFEGVSADIYSSGGFSGEFDEEGVQLLKLPF